MKLLRAHIENFRLLKDVTFEFSTDKDRNLTVIRAANESGKTTLLTALQWGLFGDEALPDRGRSFRLSPIDVSSGDKVSVTISVEVDCEIPTRTGSRKYRLIRFVTETVRGGQWERGAANVNLFHLTPNGAAPVDNPEAHIRPHLPRELREVFFTDGDRALSFIEGSKGDQMKRVEGAIRSLLGLTVVEDALSHTRKVSTELNQKIKKDAGNREELQTVSDRLSALEEQRPGLEEQVRAAREARLKLEDLEEEADRKLSDALRKGNREDLEKQRQAAIRGRQSAEKDTAQAARDHANLFRSELLGKQLLAGPFAKAKSVLDGLHKQGKIPNQTIPVLEDRLNQPNCICGESLDPNDAGGQRRRAHIQHLIEDSRNSDALQEKVTALYYGAQELLRPVEGRAWRDEYSDVFERRQRANTRCREFGEQESAVEAKIAALPDVDIQQLRTTRDHYRSQAKDAQSKEIRLNSQLEAMLRDIKLAEAEREKLLQHDEKGMKIGAELEVAHDLQQVLTNALETMKTRELKQVGDRMNALFLEMIGADPAQRSIITQAAITPEFRIVVFGRFDHPLDPSQDLNGASRRALTIAFILALTKVSEVEAPNVIDTPLGMTSGYVKRAIVQLASQESSQLILFLTHDEIKGCEDILDEHVGRICTFTNPALYPKILANDPGTNDTGIMLCDCDHHRHCQICELRKDAKPREAVSAIGA
jgi:DNA sulfur modification protein DndD